MSLFSSSDIAEFRSDNLMLAWQGALPEVTLSEGYLLRELQAAEAEVAQDLKVLLQPTTIFPYEPTTDEVTALNGTPYEVEPGYDYDAAFFQADSWGYIVTRQVPVRSVEFIRMAYPSPVHQFYALPNDWIRLDKKAGHIRLVPASQAMAAPLSAFIMQAMGGGRAIPFMIQVKYVAGIDAKNDPKWANVLSVIYKKAALRVVESAFKPQSESISADGLSQSLSFDAQKHRDSINETMFGPKGSNGGLYTAIHGIMGTVAGVMA